MNVALYTENQRKYLDLFCQKCKEEGIVNNSSYESIKLKELKGKEGAFWVCYDNEVIVSGAGSQLIPVQTEYAIRVLYRAASLQSYRAYFPGLSRYHFTSIPFSMILPHCIEWRNFNHPDLEIVITTNINFKKHKTFNTNQLFHSLEKCGLVSHIGEILLYNVRQKLWRLNEKLYLERLQKFYKRNNISPVLLNKINLYNKVKAKNRSNGEWLELSRKKGFVLNTDKNKSK
ncbi:MAG: hypothetical protein OXJ52_07580 [Oligoflexia bacterium]|nr:hypothetical protein [Oligoflexia bacterium]